MERDALHIILQKGNKAAPVPNPPKLLRPLSNLESVIHRSQFWQVKSGDESK